MAKHVAYYEFDQKAPIVCTIAGPPAATPNGPSIEFTWDFLDAGDEHFTLILLGQEEIWREPAVYDGYYRFEEVRNLLKERYGERYAGLTYTERSMVWLFD